MIICKRRISWKKMLGVSLFTTPFIAIAIYIGWNDGVLVLLGISATTAIVVGLIIGGLALLNSDDGEVKPAKKDS